MSCLGWSSPVVEGDKVTRDSPNMFFAQEYEVIQGVLAKCSIEAFNLSIRVGRIPLLSALTAACWHVGAVISQ